MEDIASSCMSEFPVLDVWAEAPAWSSSGQTWDGCCEGRALRARNCILACLTPSQCRTSQGGLRMTRPRGGGLSHRLVLWVVAVDSWAQRCFPPRSSMIFANVTSHTDTRQTWKHQMGVVVQISSGVTVVIPPPTPSPKSLGLCQVTQTRRYTL